MSTTKSNLSDDEQHFIFDLLNVPLQSHDLAIRTLVESVEKKMGWTPKSIEKDL